MGTILNTLRQILVAFKDYLLPFTWALTKLAWGGFNFATRNQAYDRWEICEKCPKYDGERIACGICGCGVSPDVGGFRRLFEKTYYRNERCPDTPPRWNVIA